MSVKKHPYSGLEDYRFWNRAVSRVPYADIDFLPHPKFDLEGCSKISTAGSCFAQNIARHFKAQHGPFFDAEPAHPLLAHEYAVRNGYGVFSARFGNIYTVRQLRETIEQAFGLREPIHDFCEEKGVFYDLLRPSVQQDGFTCMEEAAADRHYHLGRVKAMFLESDVFIFTLGLTETWVNTEKRYAYPGCPGTTRGVYDPAVHGFKNLTFTECRDDMEWVVDFLAKINPGLKLLLTVSPVALAATYESANVLCASSYSKSVLRAVCGEIESKYPQVQYYPSYEIICAAPSYGQYLSGELREANERGITHVMRYFSNVLYPKGMPKHPIQASAPSNISFELSKMLAQADCDEVFNNPDMARV